MATNVAIPIAKSIAAKTVVLASFAAGLHSTDNQTMLRSMPWILLGSAAVSVTIAIARKEGPFERRLNHYHEALWFAAWSCLAFSMS